MMMRDGQNDEDVGEACFLFFEANSGGTRKFFRGAFW